MLRSLLIRVAVALLGTLAILYLVDSLLIWQKARANSAAAFGTVEVLLTTPTKGDRLEIFSDQPQTVTCVHALFPHYGASPCWYVQRHSVQVVQ